MDSRLIGTGTGILPARRWSRQPAQYIGGHGWRHGGHVCLNPRAGRITFGTGLGRAHAGLGLGLQRGDCRVAHQ